MWLCQKHSPYHFASIEYCLVRAIQLQHPCVAEFERLVLYTNENANQNIIQFSDAVKPCIRIHFAVKSPYAEAFVTLLAM